MQVSTNVVCTPEEWLFEVQRFLDQRGWMYGVVSEGPGHRTVHPCDGPLSDLAFTPSGSQVYLFGDEGRAALAQSYYHVAPGGSVIIDCPLLGERTLGLVWIVGNDTSSIHWGPLVHVPGATKPAAALIRRFRRLATHQMCCDEGHAIRAKATDAAAELLRNGWRCYQSLPNPEKGDRPGFHLCDPAKGEPKPWKR